jgi:hypothetical protein
MIPISYRHRFLTSIIRQTIRRRYLRFTLSYREVEDLVAERSPSLRP